MSGLLSLKEAATRLGRSVAMLRKWRKAGRLSVVRVGRLVKVRDADVEAWVRLGLQPIKQEGNNE